MATEDAVLLEKIEDIYPLTPMQRGMLVQTLNVRQEDAPYFEQFSCTIHGSLSPERLRSAWNRVTARHAVLRSCVVSHGVDAPVQVVRRNAVVPWVEHDWTTVPKENQATRLAALLRDDARLGFVFERAPLCRIHLLKVGPEEHYLIWSFHHIILDGWSANIVLSEVLTEYNTRDPHRPPNERECAAPVYRDYVRLVNAPTTAEEEKFWRSELADVTGASVIGRQSGTMMTAPRRRHYRNFRTSLGASVSDRLREFASKSGVTIATIMQAAWALALAPLTKEAPAFGLGVSIRPAAVANVEKLVGLCINTITRRVVITPEAPVAEWLLAVQAQYARSIPFHRTPLGVVHGWLAKPKMFDTVLVIENYPVASRNTRFDALVLADLDITEHTEFAATLVVLPLDDIRLKLDLDLSTVAESVGEDLMHRVAVALRNIATGQPSLVRDILNDHIDEAVPPFSPPCEHVVEIEGLLHRKFERASIEHPSRAAATDSRETVSYEELDQWANAIAYELGRRGVGCESRVGVLAGRSIGAVAAILGILKAGAAYVPLDPLAPMARLTYIVEDGQLDALLSDNELYPTATSLHADVAVLEALRCRRVTAPIRRSNLSPDNAAYIIYTSGTTGVPKGVVITHANASRLFDVSESIYRFSMDDVWTWFHSIAFDFSVWEIFGALSYGGRLLVVPHVVSRSPEEFAKLVTTEGVTVLNQTPLAFAEFVAVQAADVSLREHRLRTVILGGDRLTPATLKPWFDLYGAGRTFIYNMYGITETTVHVTHKRITDADVSANGTSPIGRPLADLSLHVLNEDLQEVPDGVPGELYVGGAGVARGYARASARTAMTFVPDPFSQVPGARLYRTGDVIEKLANGEYIYHRRNDTQVKLRGFRVELAEIEATLRRHPAVRDAAVAFDRSAQSAGRICAYIVMHDQTESDDLRAFTARELPGYMIPAIFIRVDALPRTATGKLDRKALEKYVPTPRAERTPAVVDENELVVAEVFAAVLRTSGITRSDNFFQLGGDSILAIRAVGLARQRGLKVSAKQIFECQTVERIAAAARAELVPGDEGAAYAAAPLTPIQQWFFTTYEGYLRYYNNAVILRPTSVAEPEEVAACLQVVMSRHPAMRARFSYDGEQWLQSAEPESAPGDVRFVNLSATSEATRRRIIEAEAKSAQETLDPFAGPLWRAIVFHDRNTVERIFIVAHHLAVDVTSWRLLLADFEARSAHPIRDSSDGPRGEHRASYGAWAAALAGFVRGGGLDHEIPFWKGYMRARTGSVPRGRGRVVDQKTARSQLSCHVTRELIEGERGRGRVGAESAVIAAWGDAVTSRLKLDSVFIEVERNGRDCELVGYDISMVVGWFTTITPVRFEATRSRSAAEMTATVDADRESMPSGGHGYACLRFLHQDPDVRIALERSDLGVATVNYLGHLDLGADSNAKFALADESIGESVDPRAPISHPLSLTAAIVGGAMQLVVRYDGSALAEGLVEQVVQQCTVFLSSLAEQPQSMAEMERARSSHGLDAALDFVSFDGEFTHGK